MARYFLNDEAHALLQEIFRAYRSGTDFGQVRTPEGDEGYLPPEVYVARAPAGGIPALNPGADTGTDGTAATDDVPGTAECRVYRLSGVGAAARMNYAGFTKWVYNLNGYAVPDGAWVKISRDKFGSWFVDTVGLQVSQC